MSVLMRYGAALLTAALLTTAFLSCGEKPTQEQPGESDVTTVTVGVIMEGFNHQELNDTEALPAGTAVEIIDYSADADDLTAAFRNMKNDIISGNAPDIVILDSDDMLRLDNVGGLADMFSLMEEYGGVQPEEFLPGVIDGLTVNGKLPALAEAYSIKTAAVKSKYAGREYESWTPAQAMELFEQLGSDMEFMDCWQNTELADFMLRRLALECVDVNAGTCDFSGSFTETLAFCCDKQVYAFEPGIENMDSSEMQELAKRESEKGLLDDYLVFPVDISDFGSGLAWNTYCFFGGEDITFVGYPSESGNSTVTTIRSPYGYMCGLIGITSGSPHKREAWDIVSYMIRTMQEPTAENSFSRGIPVLAEQLRLYYDLPGNYADSINGVFIMPGENEPTVSLPQEYKDMLYNYILSAKFEPYTSQEIYALVRSEAWAAVSGEETPEECADMLNNRISILLSEKG